MRKEDTKEFVRRVKALGLSQPQMGILLGRTGRAINFYVNGQRGIKPEIWVKLKEIEETPREELWQKLADAKQRK